MYLIFQLFGFHTRSVLSFQARGSRAFVKKQTMASSGNMKYAYQFGNFRTGFLIYKAEGIYLLHQIIYKHIMIQPLS